MSFIFDWPIFTIMFGSKPFLGGSTSRSGFSTSKLILSMAFPASSCIKSMFSTPFSLAFSLPSFTASSTISTDIIFLAVSDSIIDVVDIPLYRSMILSTFLSSMIFLAHWYIL